MVDNQSAIILSKNTGHHNRTKHIDTRYHFIRECVEDKKIEIAFIRTEDQLGDMFTKALGRLKFQEMRGRIGIRSTPMEELEHGRDWWGCSSSAAVMGGSMTFRSFGKQLLLFLFQVVMLWLGASDEES